VLEKFRTTQLTRRMPAHEIAAGCEDIARDLFLRSCMACPPDWNGEKINGGLVSRCLTARRRFAVTAPAQLRVLHTQNLHPPLAPMGCMRK